MLRNKLYYLFVNKIDGICYRYHKMHDNAMGFRRILSYGYLIWLNLCYYCFFCQFLKHRPDVEYYEEKQLPTNDSESRIYQKENPSLTVDAYVEKLSRYDVISFDVFDTLLFRPFSVPADVFYLIGEQMEIMDFRNIRIWAEWDARVKRQEKDGHMEIGLAEIWKNLAEDVGCDAQEGIRIEQDTEKNLCYGNSFMLQVWQRLKKKGKRIIVISDMYLPSACIGEMLENAGFTGAEKLYVSCEYQKNKASGDLFRLVKKELGSACVIHVGDNPRSDDEMARKQGWDTCHYPNVNRKMILNRPFDMSFLVGSAYRALVSNYLYQGGVSRSLEYEYGYLYGGLFVVGYCDFIHTYCKTHGIDKILFLSRDGDVLRKAYSLFYPEENTSYVYWSRKAAAKLMAAYDKHDYFRRFIYHKVNQHYTIGEILHSMELDFLAEKLLEWKKSDHLGEEEELTDRNGYLLRRFIEAHWEQVIAHYENQQKAAEQYYKEQLKGCAAAAAVDIGWAGSGAIALSYLVKHAWKIPCEITGIIAGTNTVFNAEPDASESFLQSGRLVSYLYSASHNRDLLKKHDPNKDYNVFWELLLSSPTPKFAGFYLDKKGRHSLKFGKYDANQEGIQAIQEGILDFAQQYRDHFSSYPYMMHISGRDAYAPMLLAASHHEKYLKMIEQKFDLEINVV